MKLEIRTSSSLASGQLSGGLAWLAVSGEDAPDLVGTAPVTKRALLRAKIEAVLGSVALVVAPLLFALSLSAPRFALIAAVFVVISAATGTMVQFWFRSQARRAGLSKRQIPSRLATLVEALSSILWAITSALIAIGMPQAAGSAALAVGLLVGVWLIRPRQDDEA